MLDVGCRQGEAMTLSTATGRDPTQPSEPSPWIVTRQRTKAQACAAVFQLSWQEANPQLRSSLAG